jgi:hypothetical protein
VDFEGWHYRPHKKTLLQIIFFDEFRSSNGFQAIKTRILRFIRKPAAVEAIEPNITAAFNVFAITVEQCPIAFSKPV